MSAPAGWYPDPGGQPGRFRYWDGRAWSAATTPDPSSPPPPAGLVGTGSGGLPGHGSQPTGSAPGSGSSAYGSGYGQPRYGQPAYGQGQQTYGGGDGAATGSSSAYETYQDTRTRKSGKGWWLAAAAVLVVLVVVVVLAVRALSAGNGPLANTPAGQGSQDPCPTSTDTASPEPHPNDGRVHGGPISYPQLDSPWTPPGTDDRVPFGSDVKVQDVVVEDNYDGQGHSWVASVLVARLQAGDGFFTPRQGSQIVVTCILGKFYGDAQVHSHVTKDQQATIDGHDAWITESQLSFDIPGLQTKGELLIVAIVNAGATSSGIFYASIPNTTPELVQPAREALARLRVDS